MCDLDIDIGLFPCFWFIFLPLHLALRGAWIEAQPALKLVLGSHSCSGRICCRIEVMDTGQKKWFGLQKAVAVVNL